MMIRVVGVVRLCCSHGIRESDTEAEREHSLWRGLPGEWRKDSETESRGELAASSEPAAALSERERDSDNSAGGIYTC